MDTLYTFWDNGTHYKTESKLLGLMNSATKKSYRVEKGLGVYLGLRVFGIGVRLGFRGFRGFLRVHVPI